MTVDEFFTALILLGAKRRPEHNPWEYEGKVFARRILSSPGDYCLFEGTHYRLPGNLTEIFKGLIHGRMPSNSELFSK